MLQRASLTEQDLQDMQLLRSSSPCSPARAPVAAAASGRAGVLSGSVLLAHPRSASPGPVSSSGAVAAAAAGPEPLLPPASAGAVEPTASTHSEGSHLQGSEEFPAAGPIEWGMAVPLGGSLLEGGSPASTSSPNWRLGAEVELYPTAGAASGDEWGGGSSMDGCGGSSGGSLGRVPAEGVVEGFPGKESLQERRCVAVLPERKGHCAGMRRSCFAGMALALRTCRPCLWCRNSSSSEWLDALACGVATRTHLPHALVCRDTPVPHIAARHRQAEVRAKQEVQQLLLKRGVYLCNSYGERQP